MPALPVFSVARSETKALYREGGTATCKGARQQACRHFFLDSLERCRASVMMPIGYEN
jgi:hypothetical protein